MALAHSISSLCFTGICTAPNDFGAVVSAGKRTVLREVMLGMMLTWESFRKLLENLIYSCIYLSKIHAEGFHK